MSEVDLQNKINGFLTSSFKKYLVHDFNEAIHDLKSAEVIDPENPEILYNLGINYCRMGLYKTAVVYFQKLLTMKHVFIDALEVKKILAYSLIHLENFIESLQYLGQVIELVPSDTLAISMKGYCLDMMGNQAEALRVYESILKHDNENYNAYNSMAYIIARGNGDLKKALTFAAIAHESNKSNAAYLDTMGYVYMKMGDYTLAEQYFKSALDLAPLSGEIKKHLFELGSSKIK
jgi:tetratricopeptide (TPR) repeat protein